MQDITAAQDETDDHVRKLFLPPPDGQSALYIYEDTNYGPAQPIYVDGQFVGELAPMTYVYKVVTPGKHRISKKAESSNGELIVDTEPGRNYFIRRYIKASFLVAVPTSNYCQQRKARKVCGGVSQPGSSNRMLG